MKNKVTKLEDELAVQSKKNQKVVSDLKMTLKEKDVEIDMYIMECEKLRNILMQDRQARSRGNVEILEDLHNQEFFPPQHAESVLV